MLGPITEAYTRDDGTTVVKFNGVCTAYVRKSKVEYNFLGELAEHRACIFATENDGVYKLRGNQHYAVISTE